MDPHHSKRKKRAWLTLPFRTTSHPGRLKIGLRLVLCFVFIVLLMMVADIVSLWQFNQVRIQAHLLNDVNRKSVSFLELHSNLLLFRDRLETVASTEDAHAFASEAIAQRKQLLADTEHSRELLTTGSTVIARDPIILSTLQAIQSALPEQIDTMIALSAEGDWQAVNLRLENQTKALILLSSSLVEKVDHEVANERAEAIGNIQSRQRRVILVVPVTITVTLLMAAILGVVVTRSITRPLARLDAGAKAWARGEFDYQVDARGHDELAVLGQVFNSASQQLHRLYETLKSSEEKYRAFFEQNPAGTYISTADGEILECNPALVRMFGFASPQELKGTNISALFPSQEQHQRFFEQLKTKHQLASYEQEYRRKDGSALPATVNAIGTFDQHEELIEISGFLIDETERKRTEKHLLQAQKMEAIGRLAGGIAHDFNNLLGVILGSSSLILENEHTPSPFRREVQDILDASRHAASLTRQLLAFSRKQVLQPTLLNLNHVIQDVDMILRRLIGEDIEIRTVLAPDLAFVKTDSSQIEQVILNLCVNARDAMPKGGSITIETTNVTADAVFAAQHIPMQPGRYARLSVSDTGTGMDKTTLSHIFEPFFTTKSPEKGTGLGLSTVYGIVKQSGGYISAYSEPNQGTTIFIYLPAMESAKELVTTAELKPAAIVRGTETILLVEDAAALRTLTRKILETCGYKVLEAEDAKRAIQILEEYNHPVDLLLTDVIMPQMSGPALATYLLAKEPMLKVLFMSGYTDDAIADNGLLKPGAVLLEKPFTMQALTEKIREILDGANSG